mmetsp:Transcript_30659/g.69128  ORF Transcript_30659/g.69128 Transcript_30659/m.69128 type:complete len:202 (-) Transcript_30659:70-675(-)
MCRKHATQRKHAVILLAASRDARDASRRPRAIEGLAGFSPLRPYRRHLLLELSERDRIVPVGVVFEEFVCPLFELLLAEAAEQNLHTLVHIDRARGILVVHHKLHNVEQPPGLPSSLVMSHTIEHGFELVPAHGLVAILVHLPDHVLDIGLLALVAKELQIVPELIHVNLLVAFLVEAIEHTLQVLEFLRLVVFPPVLLHP